MAKYIFSKISIFSMDEEDDGNVTPMQPPIPDVVLISVDTTPLALEPAMDVSSPFLTSEPLLPSESVRWQGKWKETVKKEGENRAQKRNPGDEGIMKDARRVR
ncbi:hypothetical protein Fot_32409 [Forsythia ovata]|uniref:Uncharacterized protein n=1 Tax=Forsythia ovata TaxID=205694 RepID=A0ABD1T7R7_9LAMI